MKIYNPSRRTKFTVRQLHNVVHKFESVSSLRLALYHECEDEIPDESDYCMGYFEGKQQAKKWLVSNQDLEAMYRHFQGKPCIFIWCNVSARPIFHIRFRPLDQRDAVSWVEMDGRQKEWSIEVSKE